MYSILYSSIKLQKRNCYSEIMREEYNSNPCCSRSTVLSYLWVGARGFLGGKWVYASGKTDHWSKYLLVQLVIFSGSYEVVVCALYSTETIMASWGRAGPAKVLRTEEKMWELGSAACRHVCLASYGESLSPVACSGLRPPFLGWGKHQRKKSQCLLRS